MSLPGCVAAETGIWGSQDPIPSGALAGIDGGHGAYLAKHGEDVHAVGTPDPIAETPE